MQTILCANKAKQIEKEKDFSWREIHFKLTRKHNARIEQKDMERNARKGRSKVVEEKKEMR